MRQRQPFAVLLLIGRLVLFLFFEECTALSSSMPISDCAVIGVGVLGTLVCRDLLADDRVVEVTGITRTDTNHASIRDQVTGGDARKDALLRLVTSDTIAFKKKFRNVLFCAPPSGFDDYPGATQEAIERYWLGPQGGGQFVFTSSGAVYGDTTHDIVTEDTPVDRASTALRVQRLIRAEDTVLQAGGCCLRLAGLYNLLRGPHNYYLTNFATGKVIDSPPDGLVNLLHYEDAAAACLAALRQPPSSTSKRVFLISDGHPTSRYHLCQYALKAAYYRDRTMPQFNTTSEAIKPGKLYDGSLSNQILQWTPQYTSFQAFMEVNA
jgi:nucleoside-diphosphate-sugar epimerase